MAKSLAGVTIGAGRQQYAILKEGSSAHGVTRVDGLSDREVHEIARGNDFDLAGRNVGFVDDAAHASVMIDV